MSGQNEAKELVNRLEVIVMAGVLEKRERKTYLDDTTALTVTIVTNRMRDTHVVSEQAQSISFESINNCKSLPSLRTSLSPSPGSEKSLCCF